MRVRITPETDKFGARVRIMWQCSEGELHVIGPQSVADVVEGTGLVSASFRAMYTEVTRDL